MLFIQKTFIVVVSSFLLITIFGDETDESKWASIDTDRNHLPFLESSYPGECPDGSICRMMYLTFVVPKMSKVDKHLYNFDYGLLHCSSVFSDNVELILNGNQATFLVNINLNNNNDDDEGINNDEQYGMQPGQVMNCLSSYLLSDTSIMFSQPFTGNQIQSYTERRDYRRYLPISDKFEIIHETSNNLREFNASINILFPRTPNPKVEFDCCRSLFWHVGYGLHVFMEECKLGCKIGRSWGDKLEPEELETSPIHRWKEIYSSEFFMPGDPDFVEAASRIKRHDDLDIDENNVPGVNGIKSKREIKETKEEKKKTKEEDEQKTDFQTPFFILLGLYAGLSIFILLFLIGLLLLYLNKKKRMQQQQKRKPKEEATNLEENKKHIHLDNAGDGDKQQQQLKEVKKKNEKKIINVVDNNNKKENENVKSQVEEIPPVVVVNDDDKKKKKVITLKKK